MGHLPNLELLSPARNFDCAKAAVDHGADAVYIGPPSFGARVSAGNSIKDIERLISYAHPFGVKVYITLNTILREEELEDARRLAVSMYNIGADALIIQDMGLLQMDLPPIALHASTQMDNRSPEKVKFLQDAGFSQVVLARELSLEQIAAIKAVTTVPLEAFVHGALCVSYSGRCYMSAEGCGRSANMGACAQYCRLPYDLIDEKGNVLVKQKHLLSLQDMDRSDYLAQMAEAGITSFKIEGRLKDQDYVKNITAWYRKRIDALQYGRTSLGKTTFFFEPDPEQSFHRGATPYFINGHRDVVAQIDTPKSTGKRIGRIKRVEAGKFILESSFEIHNADGLCFLSPEGVFCGFLVNRALPLENGLWKIEPASEPENSPQAGTIVYRNLDRVFLQSLSGESAKRSIGVKLSLLEREDEYILRAVCEEGSQVEISLERSHQLARSASANLEAVRKTLLKWGDTRFAVQELSMPQDLDFMPVSQWADVRRQCSSAMEAALLAAAAAATVRQHSEVKDIRQQASLRNLRFPDVELAKTYESNISNSLAQDFYRHCGVDKPGTAYEIDHPEGVVLMNCKHCIKWTMGYCHSEINNLFLRHGEKKYFLRFNCKDCEMNVIATNLEQ